MNNLTFDATKAQAANKKRTAIKEICEQTNEMFNTNGELLKEIIEEWTPNGVEIIGFKIIENDCLIISSKFAPDPPNQYVPAQPAKFFLHRYFKVGNSWHVSQDVNGANLENFMKHLIQKYEK